MFKAWSDLRRLPRTIWILCATILVNRMGTMVLPFLALYLSRKLGFSLGETGLIITVYGAVALVMGPFAGILADRYGAGRTAVFALLAAGFTLFLYPLAHDFRTVIAVTVLFAILNETFRPANGALMTQSAPAAMRRQAFALQRFAVNLGMSIGPALGGFLAKSSFTALFWIDGLTCIGAALLLWLTAPELLKRTNRAATAPETVLRDVARMFKIADPRLWAILAVTLPTALIFFQTESAMPLHLVQNLGFSEATFGLLLTINTLIVIAVEIPLTSRISHWSYAQSGTTGALLLGAGFGAMVLTSSPWGIAATVVVWTFGEMFLSPTMSSYVAEISPRGKEGLYMGMFAMVHSLGFMIAPWAGNTVMARFGSSTLWMCTLALGIVAASVAYAYLPSKRVHPEPVLGL